jgi:hypothetical protein
MEHGSFCLMLIMSFHWEISISKNSESLIDVSKEVGLEITVGIVSQLKYLGMTVINPNLLQEEIKRRLNSANACQD